MVFVCFFRSPQDTFGIIVANILGLIVQGCVFGKMQVGQTLVT